MNLINDSGSNIFAPDVIGNIGQWHKDRNLIEGTDDWRQTGKLLEEFCELVAAQMPADSNSGAIYDEVVSMLDHLHFGGRLKPVTGDRQEAKKDALGDMAVVAINIAERNRWSYTECLEQAYTEIEHRKGKMVNGTYVKEGDS
jgi:hypothetical protein